MENQPGEKRVPSEQVSTEALKQWVEKVVEAGGGNNQSLQQVGQELEKFKKYESEVYSPVLRTYIGALRASSENPSLFAKSLVSVAAMMFAAGYIEGKQRQIEVARLNTLFDKGANSQ